jgi:hypothetical protein
LLARRTLSGVLSNCRNVRKNKLAQDAVVVAAMIGPGIDANRFCQTR